MRTTLRAAVVVAILILAACIGNRTNIAITKPALTGWESVETSYEIGVNDAVRDGDLDAEAANVLRVRADLLEQALRDENVAGVVSADWPSIRDYVERGIAQQLEDGLIGPGVATSLRNELDLFNQSIQRLTESHR